MPWGTDSLINSKYKKTNQAHNLRAPPPEQEELSCPLHQHQILLLQATTSFSLPTLKMLSYVLFCDTHLHCTCSLIYEAFFTLVVEKRQDVSNAYIFTLTLGWIPHLWGLPSCECEDACVRNTLYHLFVVCFIRDFATFSEL